MPKYYIALIDNNNLPFGYGTPANTVTVQLRVSANSLAPYAWQYVGLRTTTKKALKKTRKQWLHVINAKYSKAFNNIIID